MGSWYTLGLVLGLGVAIGVVLAALLGGTVPGTVAAAIVACAAGLALGALAFGWGEAVLGAVGGALGAAGGGSIVIGARRRGGTRGGTALFVACGGLALAALALVPLVGYVEALLVPGLARRVRRRQTERYAGLRTLAK